MITVTTMKQSYQFQACDPSGKWNAIAGVYLFVKDNLFGPATILYAGMTTSFAERMPGHDRWEEAQRLGATGILAMPCSLVTAPLIERDLIEAFNPPMNAQYRTNIGRTA